jgi:hypothetical protein
MPKYFASVELGHHLCGIELTHASASDQRIAAGLGHSTMKQVQTHRKQAARRICAMRCMSRELHNEAINLASNITKLRA